METITGVTYLLSVPGLCKMTWPDNYSKIATKGFWPFKSTPCSIIVCYTSCAWLSQHDILGEKIMYCIEGSIAYGAFEG